MFVRNPWARAVSLYEHRKMHKDIDAALSFSDWLKVQRVGIEECEDRFRGPFEFRAFAYGEEEQNLADRVIRLEDIDKELPGLLEELRVPCPSPIPRFNATVHDDYVKYYDTASRLWVAERFEFEIELFRYRFDGQ